MNKFDRALPPEHKSLPRVSLGGSKQLHVVLQFLEVILHNVLCEAE